MRLKEGVNITVDRLKEIVAGIQEFPRREVLVGIPADDTDGERGPQTGSNLRTEQVTPKDRAISEMTNAQLGYIHEHGAPERNIPARPFLIPGVREGQKRYVPYMRQAASAILAGDAESADKAMNAAGLAAMSAVQSKIRRGPFAPLSPATIARRRQRSAGSSYRRKAKTAADVTPLIDTAQMLRSVTYVVRTK